ncbi:MAG TPA: metalloregulator ArsR/SmtB family transcription factor [Anaerolineaceae bacterium]|nr:metalloregulator ArsR/SmtB family transcription factor [Anaerolineaceae bacterium]
MITEKISGNDPYEQQAQMLKVLTHPARLAILDILRDGEHCVCHMEAYLGYRQAYLSQQIAVLREAGLILDRREGWNIFYRVTDPRIYTVLDAVQELFGRKPFSPRTENVKCPCPHCNPNNKT